MGGAGAAPIDDLSLDSVHTFAVGDGQSIVHNCPRKVDWRNGDEPGMGKGRDRLRGRDAKRVDRNVDKAGKYLGKTKEERRGFGDYIEQLKNDVDAPNDRNYTWQQLLEHGRDYRREVRGGLE